ncbi:histidinol phosphate aminotransferase [Flavobacterium psychrophilum]|nr:histidinol phosphate aminotransferase [Flavobacterium psychrophilum]AOE51404.1 histidinol phosphate aminotransferase [Flavobacterium psychrophilum]
MIDVNKLVRPNILSLKPYSSARSEFKGSHGIFLDANENPFGSLNRYPDPLQSDLKQKLSEIKAVPAEQIFIGNGSDEVIDLCFRIFCEPGKDKALIFTPTYGMYQVCADINNIELLQQPLNENFQINPDAAKEVLAAENLKLVFICSPNNPTGNSIDAIEEILFNFNGIVVVDEAYIDFSRNESLSEKLNQYPNLIVLQTLSKAWGLAAARIGMAFCNTVIIDLLNKVKPPYNISQPNYEAAIEILNKKGDYEYNKNILLNERDNMIAALKNIATVLKVHPTDANFILIEVKDANKIYNRLKKNFIIIRNRDKEIKNTLRITVGNPAENKALMDALENIKL